MIGWFGGVIKKYQWGANSIVALYLSLLSGAIVALQYNPFTPYYSVNALDLLVPFGAFWRSLHFYASQIFFLLASVHLTIIVVTHSHRKISLDKWISLVASLVIVLMILFTGYLLRGDATGTFAGSIAENIFLSLPIAGKWFSSLLFSIEEVGLRRVYANHLIGLGLIWLVLSWSHIRRYTIKWDAHCWLVVGTVLFSAIFTAPLEPERLGTFNIIGPWFFIGIQELLHFIQPFWAGIIFPASFIVALCLLNYGGKVEARAKLFVCCWLIFYAGLTIAALVP